MKLCSLCGNEGKFRKRPNGKEYAHCDKCQNEITARHYQGNKEQYLERNRLRRKEVKRLCVEYLRQHPCVDCGESDPVVLDFDHVKGKKFKNIADMVGTYPWLSVLKEIEKCVVRCANCHRRKTYGKSKKFQGAVGPAEKTGGYEPPNHGAHP